jgi:HD-GYP domain-containing protein (c-di-GMP phosphodiesterase class II)
VVDALDAIRSDRIYRPGRPFSVAVEEIKRCAGTQFDPAVVEAFVSTPESTWEVIRLRVERMAQEAARLDREDGLGEVGRFWERREQLRQTGK